MAMRDPDGGGLSQPRTASGADEQNGYGFSPCERPPHEQQVCTLVYVFSSFYNSSPAHVKTLLYFITEVQARTRK